MDLTQILGQLKGQLGDKVDLSQIKSPSDLGKLSELLQGTEIPAGAQDLISKFTGGSLGDLDGDGKQESLSEEIIGKAQQVLGGLFGGK
ncbi:MAG: hypothetical protein MJZ32_03225 [Bacteroidaceae bacterium]|nr:hypothetical protein [Bacteroidaceae bacterium]